MVRAALLAVVAVGLWAGALLWALTQGLGVPLPQALAFVSAFLVVLTIVTSWLERRR